VGQLSYLNNKYRINPRNIVFFLGSDGVGIFLPLNAFLPELHIVKLFILLSSKEGNIPIGLILVGQKKVKEDDQETALLLFF
jgi:hypothetical protein